MEDDKEVTSAESAVTAETKGEPNNTENGSSNSLDDKNKETSKSGKDRDPKKDEKRSRRDRSRSNERYAFLFCFCIAIMICCAMLSTNLYIMYF